MELITSVLLVVHITAGFVALASGFAAALCKILELPHRWHIMSGRSFFWSMVAIFCTAVPISIITDNTFLLLIAIFSFYLAFSGWCYAKNRSGKPRVVDWVRAAGMLLSSLAMGAFGAYLLSIESGNGVTMLVFAAIGAGLSINDLRIILSGGVTGVDRIANHLTMMLAGTIAATTAFLVVNIEFHPAYVIWLAPTIVITPIIVAMNFKVRRAAGQSAKQAQLAP